MVKFSQLKQSQIIDGQKTVLADVLTKWRSNTHKDI